MKKISFLLLGVGALVFAGCSVTMPTENLVDPIDGVVVEENTVTGNVGGADVTGTLNEDGSLVVEAGDKIAEVSVDSEGTIIVDTNIDTSNVPVMALADWCISGELIEKKLDESNQASFEITGIEMFKGGEFCLATGTVFAAGIEIPTSIYAQGPESDFWVVSEILGKTVEQKIQAGFQ